tara:strand:- start:142 stop:2658 length:2517 start_codon:yes stop_codon:yes gene_type:complete
MRFFQAIFLGVFLLSNVEGKEAFHVKGPFDVDNDNVNECLIFNSKNYSILFIEINSLGLNDTLWSYKFENEISIADGDFIDLDNDGELELIIIPKIINVDKNIPWLYVFRGSASIFNNEPLVYSAAPLSLTAIRPSSLTILSDPSSPLGVCFASPVRKGMIFNLQITEGQLKLINPRLLSNSSNNNGYGAIQMSSFSSNKRNYISILSVEKDSLHTTIFDAEDNYNLLESRSISFDTIPLNLNTPIMPRTSKYDGKDGLLLPISSDDVFLLSIVDSGVMVSTTNISKHNAFPTDYKSSLQSILKSRKNVVALKPLVLSSIEPISRVEPLELPPNDKNLFQKINNVEKTIISSDKNLTSLPKMKQKLFHQKTKKIEDQKKYNMLSPTLGDFLTDIKKNNKQQIQNDFKTSIPKENIDMKSVNWADEAGFTYMDITEYTVKHIDTVKPNPIPILDTAIASFVDEAKQFLINDPESQDSTIIQKSENEIDLYYVMVMTPATETRDRYIFDGEAPFGVSVNQIPPTGKATHFQHGVSADLANLNPGDKYDFAYSLRDGYKDTLTTFTMVHDLQTNVVLMSISPTSDSVSQSYQPESFDPKLFEFPNYFFEGFPTSLDMDFTDKLIRFSFDGVEDSIYQGIYLSSTTPSTPPQSLAMFLDQGKIQSVKGEVSVRANGSKKITTQFDLVGSVEPSLMFSKLIQEAFPEDLKVKLLQGASLEEPLFGPKGKHPKIIREPRLPEAQLALPQQEVPVSPKQSVVPDINSKVLELNISNKAKKLEALENDEIFLNSNLNQQKNQNNNTKKDSLKLEQSKNLNKTNIDIPPPDPEMNQSEIENIINNDE